jgi:thymidylate synthase
MSNLDKQYIDLLQDILDNGVKKQTRNGEVLSVFGKQIRHKMSEGFPLLTTKKMAWKQIVTELLWFLKGDTNIKYLVENGCRIWDGDAYKNYKSTNPDYLANDEMFKTEKGTYKFFTQEEFINKIKTDDEFAKKWGELGPIYGKQWRSWEYQYGDEYSGGHHLPTLKKQIDQIANLINDLKTNPDSRRLMVNAWNVGELDQMVLPPCHYGFQVYTRELNRLERIQLGLKTGWKPKGFIENFEHKDLEGFNIPTRAISLMWNQRSVDTFLGLPFNIASYGLLLEIIAKEVNMVPDELIGNLGDTHLYLNHIEQAKEQIGREMTWEEQVQWVMKNTDVELENLYIVEEIAKDSTPKRTRQPYPLPKLNINTEFWQTESGECGVGPLKTNLQGFEISDFVIENYQSHPPIKAPLSN